jgi:hypothetical protein
MGVDWLKMLYPPLKLALSEKYTNSAQTYERGDSVLQRELYLGTRDTVAGVWDINARELADGYSSVKKQQTAPCVRCQSRFDLLTK